ncbi:uncharacterized protein J3D65DRAFT_212962 [Phyllosticta citribraziliensis]|uniref:Uncharacterized protein n=1 Tax=Phyllosticta citribraziliensis TaxID=989973 RepID=A0ABR1M7T6_9PEZI
MGNTLAAAELGCVCGISRTASRTLELFFEAGGHARLPLSEFVADYESREEVCGTTAVSSNRAASFSERWEGAASRRGQHDQLARVTVRKATTPVREVSTRTFERVFPRILFDFNCVNHDASRLHRHSDDMATQFHLEQFRAPLQHVVKTPPWWHCSLDFPSGSCAVSLCFANFSSHSTFLSVDVCSVLVHAVDRRRKTRLDRRSDERPFRFAPASRSSLTSLPPSIALSNHTAPQKRDAALPPYATTTTPLGTSTPLAASCICRCLAMNALLLMTATISATHTPAKTAIKRTMTTMMATCEVARDREEAMGGSVETESIGLADWLIGPLIGRGGVDVDFDAE